MKSEMENSILSEMKDRLDTLKASLEENKVEGQFKERLTKINMEVTIIGMSVILKQWALKCDSLWVFLNESAIALLPVACCLFFKKSLQNHSYENDFLPQVHCHAYSGVTGLIPGYVTSLIPAECVMCNTSIQF